jgi:hypothetical protein
VIRRILAISVFGLGILCLPAEAGNIVISPSLGQANFRLLSEDLGGALSYKPLSPAEPLGATGFDLGVELSSTQLANPAVYGAATGSSNDSIPLVKAEIQKGLPFGIDLGATYTTVPSSNIKLVGAELRYAIVKGGVATPAVAVRASYTALQGVNTLDFTTTGVDLSISKGFAFFTPYAGVGNVWVSSTPNNVPGLVKEDFSLTKVFAGLNMNLGFVNIALEGDKTGDATTYGLKFGMRF